MSKTPTFVPTSALERLATLAMAVAITPPEKRGYSAADAKAYVYWEHIEEIRAVLDANGIDWRVPIRDRKEARRMTRLARQAAATLPGDPGR